MGADTNSLRPTSPGSGANMAFGVVSAKSLVVIHEDSAPIAEVIQPEGKNGIVTESKFSPKTMLVTPSGNETDTNPRSVPPSCNCNVPIMLSPHIPAAVKVNDALTPAPPATSAPK